LRRTRRCGDEYETKSMNAMIMKSAEFLFRDLGFISIYNPKQLLAIIATLF